MIKVKRCLCEPESIKRGLLELWIGYRSIHITRKEALKLRKNLGRFKLED